ncbi:NAD(P)-binding protein [Stipitochalara longipes BDJ]|nr:NAD(P)-binding protein [Stipitochalara longipes BDJ]
MSSKKVLVVFGATGNQGGSVVKAILNDPSLSSKFEIRGISRDPSKPAAAVLAEKGVTLVKADLNDKTSLAHALKGAYAVFAVTNWHEIMNKEREIQQGKNVADVAKEQNVQHLIWSSLPYASKISEGKITGVLHFDSKAIVEEYISTINIPYTALHLGIFFSYLLYYLKHVPSSSTKSYKFAVPFSPTLKIPLISVASDTGKYVKAILLNREGVLGKQVSAGEKYYSPEEIVKVLREVGGLDVVVEQIDEQEYRTQMAAMGAPEFYVDDMVDNIRFVETYGFFSERAAEEGRELVGEHLESFEEWVTKSPQIAALK